MKSLEEKLEFTAGQLSEDFEEVIIIARKTWRVDKDNVVKLYFSTSGDDYVLKTMTDMVSKELETQIEDAL
jgi:hypothetical protein